MGPRKKQSTFPQGRLCRIKGLDMPKWVNMMLKILGKGLIICTIEAFALCALPFFFLGIPSFLFCLSVPSIFSGFSSISLCLSACCMFLIIRSFPWHPLISTIFSLLHTLDHFGVPLSSTSLIIVSSFFFFSFSPFLILLASLLPQHALDNYGSHDLSKTNVFPPVAVRWYCSHSNVLRIAVIAIRRSAPTINHALVGTLCPVCKRCFWTRLYISHQNQSGKGVNCFNVQALVGHLCCTCRLVELALLKQVSSVSS